jgi:hypothetical protein
MPEGIPPAILVVYFTANRLGFYPQMYMEHPIAAGRTHPYSVAIMGPRDGRTTASYFPHPS